MLQAIHLPCSKKSTQTLILPSIIVCVGLFVSFFVFVRKAKAATLYFLPPANEISDTDSLVVEARLDTEGEAINALEGAIAYPAGDVEILDILDGGSLIELWPQKPAVKDGRIDFIGGVPGGYKGDGKIFSIILKPKRQVKLSWDTASKILLNDGLGTEAAVRFLDGHYEVFPAGEEAVKIVSADHPDQNVWYPNGILTLRWEVKPDFLYSYILSRDSLIEPDDEAETVFEEGVEYAGLADGIYYFHLKIKSSTGTWSHKATFRAMIDATPPEFTEATVGRDAGIFDGRYFLSFITRDAASGVVQTMVAEGDEIKNDIWREAGSPYLLKDQKKKSEIKIRARDKAGNEIIYTIPAEKLRLTREFVFWFLAVVIFIILILVWRVRAKFFIAIVVIWIFAGLSPSAVLAQSRPSASLFLAPAAGTFARGENFNVAVRLSSPEETINAAEGTLNFPKDILEVTRIARAGSVFTLWPQEPVFSNQDGAVHFAGGLPNPGFKGQSAALFVITFRGKAAGEATVYFSSGSVLANDGFGSDIIKTLGSSRYTIMDKAPIVPPAVKLVLPPTPVVFSSTHSDTNRWYAARDVTLGWDLPREVNGVSFLFDRQPDSIPEKSSQGLFASKTLTATEDGLWYFHLRFRNASAWGGTAHFKIQIDTEKPLPFSIFIKEDGRTTEAQPTFIFEAADAVSGIDYYAIVIDNSAPIKWQKTEEWPLFKAPRKLSPGKHKIVIKAFDLAGNFQTAEKEFEVVEAATPIIEFISKQLWSGDPLVVEGTSPAKSKIIIKIVDEKTGAEFKHDVHADERGRWLFVFKQGLADGRYNLRAAMITPDGLEGPFSEPLFIAIFKPIIFYLWLTSVAIAAAIIIALVSITLYYRRRLLSKKRRFSRRSVVKKQ